MKKINNIWTALVANKNKIFILAKNMVNYHFLSKTQKEDIQGILELDVAKETLKTWLIYTGLGNLLPVLIAFFINMMINPVINWMTYLNNGSISIVAYNMLISSVFYLQETTISDTDSLRKKILGIGSLLLFINISLFTLQTTSFGQIGPYKNYITLFAAFVFLILSYNSGRIMVILQKRIAEDYYRGAFQKYALKVDLGYF